jgi:RNA 3'-phosphate cyclase
VDAIEVDGSFGEGGGQIVRTAVTFSVIQRRAIHITKIRVGREVPGLRQQHASTLRAMAEIFGAELRGDEVGSSEVSFSPGGARTSLAAVDMKTAASIPLLLQAVIPAVALTHSSLTLELRGGTDVPWSPTFDYLTTVAAKAYALLGITFRAEAARRGYYPRGGGIVVAEVEPAASVNPVGLDLPREPATAELTSRCAGLPRHVAERQLESMGTALASSGISVASKTLSEEQADSPGSSVLAAVTVGGRILGADAIGERGRPAEEVGREAAHKFAFTLGSGAPVDVNLADMIAPLLSMASEPSSLIVPEVTLHLKTGLYVARLFTGCEYSWRQKKSCFLVEIRPVSGSNASPKG